MSHRIKKVEYVDGYRLKLHFDDKKIKIVNLENMLKNAKNMLLPLVDIDYFKQVTCDGITICWPNDVDLCPDALYEMGNTITPTKRSKIPVAPNIQKNLKKRLKNTRKIKHSATKKRSKIA